MALFLFPRFHLILLTLGFYYNTNGPFLPVTAISNIEIPGPSINITIPPPPTLLVQQNSSALLPCTISIDNTIVKRKSDYEIDIIWYKNNKKLITTTGKRNEFQIYENGTLKLPSNDNVNGIYRCLINATNKGLGVMISSESVVTYAVLKRLLVEDTNILGKIGMYLKLDCPVKSVPLANITWKFKNYTSNNKNEIYIIKNRIFQLENGSLIINSINENDKGKYKCIAENNFASKSIRQFTWIVTISENIDNDLKNGIFLPQLQNKILYVPSGDNLKLRCMTNSETIIEWWFLRDSSSIPIKISNHSNVIYLSNVSIDRHNGTYKCSTEFDSQVFEVIVTEIPSIEQPFKSVERPLAATVSFPCKAYGNPPPEIIWYRNGIQLYNSYTVHYIPPYLRIYSLDLIDEGIYQCFAKNIVGETSTIGQIKLRNRKDIANIPKRPENIKCHPINYKTLNVTFHSRAALFMMNIHVVTENPFKWNSTMPVKVQSNSYILVDKGLPILKPFMLFLRGLVATSTIQTLTGIDQTFDTSLLSEGVKCATQGLIVNGIFFPNGIFIWWSQLNFILAKYFIIQIKELDENIFKDNIAIGTTKTIDIYDTKSDIEKILYKIPIINEKFYLNKNNKNNNNNNNNVNYNIHSNNSNILEDNIKYDGAVIGSETSNTFISSLLLSSSTTTKISSSTTSSSSSLTNLVVPGNVTGILIPNITNITVRVLVITNENENLTQDLSYLEWKTIENSTTKSFVFRITSIESRTINFAWNSIGGISCIKVCYNSLNIDAIIRDDQQKYCQQINDGSSYFSVRKLKPLTTYRMDFIDCNSMNHLGSTEVQTKADLPGPITNQRITKDGGLKLIWDPPINPNGKLLYYLVHWTIKNNTYEANVTENDHFYKFPNITENDKINASVRVVGSSGIGPPIYIDLRSLETHLLDTEKNIDFDHTLGIIIGIILSIICIMIFICLFIYQRSRFKRRDNQITTSTFNRDLQLEQNLSTTTPVSIELHEMQTLIPQQYHQTCTTERQTNFMLNDNNDIMPFRIIPNGNGIFHRMKSPSISNSITTTATTSSNNDQQHHENYHHHNDQQQQQQQYDEKRNESLSSNVYSSTPLLERKQQSIPTTIIKKRKKDLSEILLEENSPQLINYPIISHPSSSLMNYNNHNHDNHNNSDFSNLCSSSNNFFINNSKNSNFINSINLHNGSIKTILPPNKHSNSLSISTESVDSSINTINNDCQNIIAKGLTNGTNTNCISSSATSFKNSQNNLFNHLDSSTLITQQLKNDNNSCCSNDKSNDEINNKTAITLVSLDDSSNYQN